MGVVAERACWAGDEVGERGVARAEATVEDDVVAGGGDGETGKGGDNGKGGGHGGVGGGEWGMCGR